MAPVMRKSMVQKITAIQIFFVNMFIYTLNSHVLFAVPFVCPILFLFPYIHIHFLASLCLFPFFLHLAVHLHLALLLALLIMQIPSSTSQLHPPHCSYTCSFSDSLSLPFPSFKSFTDSIL